MDIWDKLFRIGPSKIYGRQPLKVASATFLLVCCVCLKESTCEIRKNVFYFTLKRNLRRSV